MVSWPLLLQMVELMKQEGVEPLPQTLRPSGLGVTKGRWNHIRSPEGQEPTFPELAAGMAGSH